jgi:hypothetical protein
MTTEPTEKKQTKRLNPKAEVVYERVIEALDALAGEM